MRRWLWVIALGILALLLLGCGTARRGALAAVTSPDEVLRISLEEAKAMVDGGDAVLYDARSAEAYREAHADGALSLPEEEVAERFDSLPNDKALIFYCT
ncbi:MAG: rhodanese-like domain-containing protein [Anaerolineae bacterium]|jgi:hypothetical protein